MNYSLSGPKISKRMEELTRNLRKVETKTLSRKMARWAKRNKRRGCLSNLTRNFLNLKSVEGLLRCLKTSLTRLIQVLWSLTQFINWNSCARLTIKRKTYSEKTLFSALMLWPTKDRGQFKWKRSTLTPRAITSTLTLSLWESTQSETELRSTKRSRKIRRTCIIK